MNRPVNKKRRISPLATAALAVFAAALLTVFVSCGGGKESSAYKYETRGGNLFITSYTEPDGAEAEYTVPSKIDGKKVYGIASGAYKNCAFTSLVIPDGVEVLESEAFSGCGELTSVMIPSSVTELEGAFKLCVSIADMKIKGDGYKVEDGTVYSKDGKTLVLTLAGTVSPGDTVTIKDGVEKIAPFAFNRSEMSALVLNQGLKEIGEQAFYSCKRLSGLKVNCPDLKIGVFAFGYCTDLVSVDIDDVYYIGEDAFRRCNSLKTVEAENVDYLGTGCFRMCPALTTVYISGSYNYVPADLFTGCSLLEDCILDGDFSSDRVNMIDGNEIKTINNSAFSGCAALPAPIIPDGIVKIGPYAFNQCSFTNVYIPEGVKTVSEMAFYECESVKTISLSKTLEEIGFQAFAYCENIQSVTIPKNVKKLGIMSFYSCYKLSNVTLEEGGCETMGVLCFGNCMAITRFRLPQSFRNVQTEDGEFFTTDIKESLTYDFTVQSDGTKYSVYEVYKYSYGYQFALDNDVEFTVLDNTADIFTVKDVEGGVEIVALKAEYADFISGHAALEIPDEIDGKAVVSVDGSLLSPSGAVSKFIGVEKLTLPKGLNKFDFSSLSEMLALRRVVFTGTDPKSVSLTLKAATGNLSSVTFYVPAQSFDGYKEAVTAVLGNGANVDTDPDSMFEFAEYSDGYRVVGIIDGVDVSVITSISVPEKYEGKPVLAVSQNALSKATAAVDIYIPASVTRIFDGAFSGCGALKFVHLSVDADKTVVGSGLLAGTEGVRICVPAGFAPNYLSSYDWQGYSIKSE